MKRTLAIGTFILTAIATPGAFGQKTARSAATFTRGSYLGIGAQDIDAERAKTLKLKEIRGAEVTSVEPDSPAAKAGIKDGDVVFEFNGQPVEGKDQLARMVQEVPVGRQVRIGVWRNGAAQTLTATTGESSGRSNFFSQYGAWGPDPPKFPPMPPIEMPKFQMLYQSPILGIFGESLAQAEQLAEFFGVKEGVLVKSVTRNSAAERAGIKAGDVIVKVDDSRVTNTSEISNALRAARSKSTVTVTVVRNKKEMPLTVTVDAPTARPVKAGYLEPRKVLVVKQLELFPQNRII
jgi:serine protease Do